MGTFVEVKIQADRLDREKARRIIAACPVDIFAPNGNGTLVSVSEREDECILCGQCVALGLGALSVRRRYGSGHLVSPAGADA